MALANQVGSTSFTDNELPNNGISINKHSRKAENQLVLMV